ncbi:hypothetical protein FRX31_005984 [Thalictrum thalictroides]|uniref:Uncharacterized protein n=1 Tax=Thalictrum thalictroides TaxID=46969 RepID=A0A7J6X3R8_THATH|nr:hypothetical protein FRX31_005984 [Thalictrum thalictroides]
MQWISVFPAITVEFMAPLISDHSPILLSWLTVHRGSIPFKFNNVWTFHPAFLNIVRDSWKSPLSMYGNPMFFFTTETEKAQEYFEILGKSSLFRYKWNGENIEGKAGGSAKYSEFKSTRYFKAHIVDYYEQLLGTSTVDEIDEELVANVQVPLTLNDYDMHE